MKSHLKKRKKKSQDEHSKPKKQKQKVEQDVPSEEEVEVPSIIQFNLPDEVMVKIFSFFRLPKHLCRSSQVCKGWNRLASDPILWKFLLSSWNFKGDLNQPDAEWKVVFKDYFLHCCVVCCSLFFALML